MLLISLFNRVLFCITEMLTVSETSAEPPQDEDKHINSPNNLSLEATFINHNLSQQVLHPKFLFKHSF